MEFSRRYGYAQEKIFQTEELNDETRMSLWNAYYIGVYNEYIRKSPGLPRSLEVSIVIDYLKMDYGEMSSDRLRKELKHVYLKEQWFRVFDFIEFYLPKLPKHILDPHLRSLNNILERENSAYRVISDSVCPITDDIELEAIIKIQQIHSDPIRTHIENAIRLLSDRNNPDFGNSIKESISAVEALCKKITNDDSGTLGKCLKKIENHDIKMHKAFKNALSMLYGYSSDAEGIRHSLMDNGNPPTFAEAKFMLVACSNFVNYIMLLASDVDIDLS